MFMAGTAAAGLAPASWIRAGAQRVGAAATSGGRWPESPAAARGPVVQVHGARKGVSPARSTAMAANGEVKEIHSNESTKTLLKNEALYEYMLDLMVYPRENEYLREIRLITEQHTLGYMLSPPDEAQMLSLLLKVMGARNTIEVGVFTGSSVLATALAIPDDGKVVAIDVSREFYDLGRPVIEKAGVAHKVDFREGPALPILDKLLAEEVNEGKFDFAFVDADKGNYGNYHEQLLRLVRVGGVLAYDNTLWGGSVAMPEDAPLTEGDREVRATIREFNAKIAADKRRDLSVTPPNHHRLSLPATQARSLNQATPTHTRTHARAHAAAARTSCGPAAAARLVTPLPAPSPPGGRGRGQQGGDGVGAELAVGLRGR